jgi:hypothetical protein
LQIGQFVPLVAEPAAVFALDAPPICRSYLSPEKKSVVSEWPPSFAAVAEYPSCLFGTGWSDFLLVFPANALADNIMELPSSSEKTLDAFMYNSLLEFSRN